MAENSTHISNEKESAISKLTPLEYFMLDKLYQEGKGMSEDDLIAHAIEKFEIDGDIVKKILDYSLITNHKYIYKKTYYKGSQYNKKEFLFVTNNAIHSTSFLFPNPKSKENLKNQITSKVIDGEGELRFYGILSLKDAEGVFAHLKKYSLKLKPSGRDSNQKRIADPDYWSSEVIEEDIEMDLIGKEKQVYESYTKNRSRDAGMHIFTSKAKDEQCIETIMAEYHINKDHHDLKVEEPNRIDDIENANCTGGGWDIFSDTHYSPYG